MIEIPNETTLEYYNHHIVVNATQDNPNKENIHPDISINVNSSKLIKIKEKEKNFNKTLISLSLYFQNALLSPIHASLPL